ncbi:MAG: hypothetical protein LBS84_11820 [Clostridiales bacterium]|jgi:hypothetical protein|nr:hypothetical protein [Clostridiales bacterium]
MKSCKKAIITLTFAFILPGCGGGADPPTASESPDELRQAVAIKQKPDEYSLYYEQECPLGLYEPETGCYLGAYVLSNRDINFDIKRFEDMSGKVHAISVYYLRAGVPFPEQWVISCVAENKTPYIVIMPPNEYAPYDRGMIDSMAAEFGEYYVPMFVEFYPVSGLTAKTNDYVEFFRYARRKFKEKASNAAFVWAVDAKDAADSDGYYPGDDYVDWVGLHSAEPLLNDGYGADMFKALDYLYYTYQKVKPIAVSAFAVSHYTNADFIYKNETASEEIIRVYSGIINNYPRVKMINYMDYDESISDSKKKADCYTVTENDVVMTAYKNAVSGGGFLSSIVSGGEGREVTQMIRSPFSVLRIGEYWYASEYSFEYDLNTAGALGERLISGRKYYNINMFVKNAKKDLTADDEARKLIMTSQADKK